MAEDAKINEPNLIAWTLAFGASFLTAACTTPSSQKTMIKTATSIKAAITPLAMAEFL